HQKAVHEGRKDYACDRCEKKFGEKYKLIRHQLTVHERGKDFECENLSLFIQVIMIIRIYTYECT
ncbi:unnamed protein product, partial [Trichogramma brassicae]